MTPPCASGEARLRRLGIRPTLQRLAVLEMLETMGDNHVTPNEAYLLLRKPRLSLTLGTVYNVLNEFVRVGLLRRIDLGERASYCANRVPHHHFMDEDAKRLFDVGGRQPRVEDLPDPPQGWDIVGVDVIVRIRPRRGA